MTRHAPTTQNKGILRGDGLAKRESDLAPGTSASSAAKSLDFLEHKYPYDPWCPVFGWLVSRAGFVRLAADVQITLRHKASWQTRKLARQCGVRVMRGNWRGEILDVVRYRDGIRMVCAHDPTRCRGP